MSAAEEAMKTLNQQWYNALVDGLQVSRDQFQLAQGSTTLGYDKSLIWRILDSIPPKSTDAYYNPDQHNSLSRAYGGVINNLIPQNDDSLRKELNDKYTDWITYRDDKENWKGEKIEKIDDPKEAQKQVFKNWAKRNLDPDEIDAAFTIFDQKDIISVAIAQWILAAENYAYTVSAEDLKDALEQGASKSVELNSATTSKDISETWAQVSASGKYRFFSAGGSVSWDKYIQKIATSGINVTAKFERVATLVGGPYSLDTHSASLKGYKPWWNSEALKTAKDNNDNLVWKHTAPSWEQTFGTHGNLLYWSVGLVVVDGISIKVTSNAKIDNADQENFEAAAKLGFWPFFQTDGGGGWTTEKVDFNDGSFTIESSKPKGNPNLIGVLVGSPV